MSEIAITEIGPDELDLVRDLAFRIWPEAYAGVLPSEMIGPMLASIYALDTLRADMAERGHRYWLARAAGAPIGFASAYRDADRVWIKKLYVLSDARGSGAGSKLVSAAIAGFAGATSLALYVNDGNVKSIAWYKSRGFAVEAHVPVTMGGFDFMDYVMTKAL